MRALRTLTFGFAMLSPVTISFGDVYDESVIASYYTPFTWDMRLPTGDGSYFFNSSYALDLSNQTLPIKREKIINISVWIRNDAKTKLDNFTRLSRLAHNRCGGSQDYTSGGNTVVYYFDPSFRPGIRILLNSDLYGNPQANSYFGQSFIQYDSPTEIRGYVKIDYLNN